MNIDKVLDSTKSPVVRGVLTVVVVGVSAVLVGALVNPVTVVLGGVGTVLTVKAALGK